MPPTCRQNLLKPNGECFLWTLYSDEGPVMCTAEFRKQKHCEDIFIPSFMVEAVERQRQEVERKRKYREMMEDMRTKSKIILMQLICNDVIPPIPAETLREWGV